MATFSGSILSLTSVCDRFKKQVPNRNTRGDFSSIQALDAPISGTYVSASPGPPAVNPTIFSGRLGTDMTPGHDWFEKVHLIPRTKIEFGNIVTTLTEEFEIFSAFRTEITFISWTNGAGAGLDIPDLPTPPVGIPPLTSILSPSSTRLNPVKLVVEVGPEGVPTFDALLSFEFSPGGTLYLAVSGSRISLLPFEWENPIRERLSFLTDVLEAVDGVEQRIALRAHPRQSFETVLVTDGVERQRAQAILMGWQENVFAVPLWHDVHELAAPASIGATTISVPSTTDVDLRIGGLAVLYESSTKFDVLVISGLTSNSISFSSSPLTNDYTTGKVMPVRTAIIDGDVMTRRPPYAVESFQARLLVTDNWTGAPTASASGWSTYNGKILFDDCNVLRGEMSGRLAKRVTFIDNQTGKFTQRSLWDVNKRVSTKGFHAGTRAQILALRRLLMEVRGRQKSFYLPTFIEDLTPVANLASGNDEMDISNIGYTRFVQSRAPKNLFRITFTDGSSLVREVQSSVEVSSSVERLTLDSNWPANRLLSEIRRIQFYELVRFDTDDFILDYDRVGLARMFAPVRIVFG